MLVHYSITEAMEWGGGSLFMYVSIVGELQPIFHITPLPHLLHY